MHNIKEGNTIQKLLIHHHATAYIDSEGIWMQSFIGNWIHELAKLFNEIGLLVKISELKRKEHDFIITNTNVHLYNLNPKKNNSVPERNRFIKKTCIEVSKGYDALIIRGITPRQKLIFNNCSVNYKAFLLVGSLNDSKPYFHWNKTGILVWLLYWVRRRELKVISQSSVLFANSPKIVEELQNILGIKASFMPTNTINRNHFIPLIYRKIKTPVKLLFCGRVVKEKGIEELLEAIGRLKAWGVITTLDIVGNITENYKAKLIKIIELYKLSTNIFFQGYIPFGDDLLQFYRSSDIYILPSWHEGFPHSIWEAAASCTPIIVTAVGGIPGIVSNSDVLFCKEKDASDLAEKIIHCINNSNETALRVKSLYNLAENYTVEKCAQLTFDIFNK